MPAPSQKLEQMGEEQEEDTYKHTIAAITAITEEDIEFFTPPEDQEMDNQLTMLETPAIHVDPPQYSNELNQLHSLDSYPKRVSLAELNFTNLPGSSIRRGSYQMPIARRFSLQPKLLRSQTQLGYQSGPTSGVFGSNKENVERILKRMASAIKMDLHLH